MTYATQWWPCGFDGKLNLQHFTNHVHFSKCDRMHPSDSGCSLHTGVCRLQQPACRLQKPAYECHAACCSMLHPAYRRNAGRITPVCSLHTLVLQPSCRDACSLHASLVWTRHKSLESVWEYSLAFTYINGSSRTCHRSNSDNTGGG